MMLKRCFGGWFLNLFSILILHKISQVKSQEGSCYDYDNRPKRCSPEFVNAAFNRHVVATNTCGNIESQYCVQTNVHSSVDYGDSKFERCDICDNKRRDKSHPPEYLTDPSIGNNLTWWQSDTMEFGIQYPNSVNLTLHLGILFLFHN